ncbi:hypothetical protein GOP47_0012297 [Adiantum capillus-veneris]|uniref:Uncharacterized protein n=1 Tax=Adiantum capillus-veneris TaxID=13818 RepID=A0A9D4ZGQ8_ADICA|nr:hypothetical protein GOP47_0012297 [Adiantum capillus-veneris]
MGEESRNASILVRGIRQLPQACVHLPCVHPPTINLSAKYSPTRNVLPSQLRHCSELPNWRKSSPCSSSFNINFSSSRISEATPPQVELLLNMIRSSESYLRSHCCLLQQGLLSELFL